MKRFLITLCFLFATSAIAQEEICDEVSLTRPQYKCKKATAPTPAPTVMPTDEEIESKIIVKPVPEKVKETILVKQCPTCKACRTCPAQKACPTQQCPAQKACPTQQCPAPTQQKACPAVTNNYYAQGQTNTNAAAVDDYAKFMLSAMVGGLMKPVRSKVVNGKQQETYLVPAIGAELTYFPSKDFSIGAGVYTDSFVFGKVGFLFGRK